MLFLLCKTAPSTVHLTKHFCRAVDTHVICSESLMRVEVEKTEYFGNHQDHFELNNAANTACQVNSNRTHIFVDVPLNSCGTQIEVMLAPLAGATLYNGAS